MVIEAVVENIAVKGPLFGMLSEIVKPEVNYRLFLLA